MLSHMDGIKYFQLRLDEAITWCTFHSEIVASSPQQLRSALLHPSGFPGTTCMNEETRNLFPQLVEQLVNRRASLLQTQMGLPVQQKPSPADGRVLAMDVYASLSDGAAHLVTQGFFDDDNVPPWDTWIGYVANDAGTMAYTKEFDTYLLSWVPPSLVETVERGLWINPEQCLRWAKDLDTTFVHHLVQAGLIH